MPKDPMVTYNPADFGDGFAASVSPEVLAREKAKARDLRRSQWWKRRRGTGVCHYCGGGVPPRDLTMDHVVPLARGGRSVRSNLVPACKECNSMKKHLVPVEWQAYLDHLGAGED